MIWDYRPGQPNALTNIFPRHNKYLPLVFHCHSSLKRLCCNRGYQ
jgi:hypothetical protein